jgi:hypothetical protein
VPRSPSRNDGPSTSSPAHAHSLRDEKTSGPLRYGRKRCGLIAPRPVDCHRGRDGRGPSTDKETYHCAHRHLHQERERLQRDQDRYTGTIRTLSLDIKVRLVPARTLSEREGAGPARAGSQQCRERCSVEADLEGEHRVSLGEARRPLLPGTDLRQPRRRRRRSRLGRADRILASGPRSPQTPRPSTPGVMLSAALAKRPETRRSHDTTAHMSNSA